MIYFDFYGFTVKLSSSSEDLLRLIKLNFSYFHVKELKEVHLEIEAFLKNGAEFLPKELVAKKQSVNSITYDLGDLRYNDYYGEALSILDYRNSSAKIFSSNINRLHEITYLLMMSRQGKWCDKKGIHKIHSMAVANEKKNLLVMLPMKGGKSTLFTKFLAESKFQLISDDSPCVNSKGEILNFPIRFGIEKKPMYEELLSSINKESIFTLQRNLYGEKILVDMMFFHNRIAKPKKETVLVQGFRQNGGGFKVKKVAKVQMLKYLLINMTVGVGLPMVIEYFIENNIRDHLGNINIFLKRLYSTTNLLFKSDCYFAYMGNDIDKNFNEIKKLMK